MIEVPSLSMKTQPRQFGLFALFLLMTTAAVALAVIRLPIEFRWKTLLVGLIVGCFARWATHKYRAQRPTAISPRDYFWMAAATFAALFVFLVLYFWHYELQSNQFNQRVLLAVGLVAIAIARWFFIKRLWNLYSAPLPPNPPKATL